MVDFPAFLFSSLEQQAGQECTNNLGHLSLCALSAAPVVEGNGNSLVAAQHVRASLDTCCLQGHCSLSASTRFATRQLQDQTIAGSSALLVQHLGASLSNVSNAQMCLANAPMQLRCKCPALRRLALSEDFPKQALLAQDFQQCLRWFSSVGTHRAFHFLQVLNSALDNVFLPLDVKQHDGLSLDVLM